MRNITRIAWLSLALAGSACNNTTGPSGPAVAQLLVTPDTVRLVRGDSVGLTVTPLDANGNLLVGVAVSVSFSSGDTDIIRVSVTGLARSAGKLGDTKITVSAGGVHRDVPVSVKGIYGHTILDGSPFGAAATRLGASYVLRHTGNLASRFNLPDTAVVTSLGIAGDPTYVTFDSAGTTAYVTSQFNQRILVINAATNTIVDSIATTGNPDIVRVAPDDHSIWVSTNVDSLYQIDRGSKAILARYHVSLEPNSIVFAPTNDSLLYVSTVFTGSVVEINYKRKTFGRTFSPGGTTQAIVISPDGGELYVSNEELGEIEIYNLTSGVALPVIKTNGPAFDLVLSPDGKTLWTSLSGSGLVRAYDRPSRALRYTFVTGGAPRRIAMTLATTEVVVANEAGWVDFIK